MQIAGMTANPLPLHGPETYHLPAWGRNGDRQRVSALRRIVLTEGRDPRVAEVAVRILRAAGAASRAYQQQAAALLSWVQQNIYYINEPGEKIQSPAYTLLTGKGDCDCLAVLLASFYESIALPWRFVLSGRTADNQPVRWIEGTPYPAGIKWRHIYLAVGWPPFQPNVWAFAEPTARVPLGWDIIQALARGGPSVMPEMRREPMTLGSLAERVREEVEDIAVEVRSALSWKKLVVTAVVGAITTLATQAFLRTLKRASTRG